MKSTTIIVSAAIVILLSTAQFIFAQTQPLLPKPIIAEASTKKPDFHPDVVPSIVEIEVRLIEWGATPEAGVTSDLSGTNVQVMERVAALEKAGKLTTVQTVRLTTLDGYPAFAQIGERRPRVVTSMMSPRGTSNGTVMESIGTLISVTPHVQRVNRSLWNWLRRSQHREFAPTEQSYPKQPPAKKFTRKVRPH